jgi:hypothetical protein
MSPDIDERLASVVRALSEVILPHLPAEASLAQEQVHLCIGHLQIIRGQIDEAPAFERGELDDALALAEDLSRQLQDAPSGEATIQALADLRAASTAAIGQRESATGVRAGRMGVLQAIDGLVKAVASDGSASAHSLLSTTILKHEAARSLKDRQWFAPFGFDTL